MTDTALPGASRPCRPATQSGGGRQQQPCSLTGIVSSTVPARSNTRPAAAAQCSARVASLAGACAGTHCLLTRLPASPPAASHRLACCVLARYQLAQLCTEPRGPSWQGRAPRQRRGGLKQLEMQHGGTRLGPGKAQHALALRSAGTDRGATGASSPCAAEGRYSSAMGCSGWVTVIVGRASSGENAKCVNGEGGDGPQF